MRTIDRLVASLIERLKHAAIRPAPAAALSIEQVLRPTAMALYVHVPFCGSLCSYCVFNKVRPRSQMLDYAAALGREIAYYGARPELGAVRPSSIFFGGGTPSYPPAEVIELTLEAIDRAFGLPAGLQITLEANPESVEPAKLERYRAAGVNRISLGVQSFDEARLARLGRRHRRADIDRAIEEIRAAGFDELSIDLMYGLPEQSLAGFVDELAQAIAAPVTHVSLFPVIYKPGTPIYRHRPARRPLWSMYTRAVEALDAAGFEQYTTEDFTRGVRCAYQLDVWQPPPKPCLGLGAGALSSFGDHNWHNVGAVDRYVELAMAGQAPIAGGGQLSARQRMHDHLALSTKCLRLDASAFEVRFGVRPERLFGPLLALARIGGLLRRTPVGDFELSRRGAFYASLWWSEYILGKLEQVAGEAQSDQLAGEAQSDQLAGEAQSDQLAGEAQSDQLAGEAQSDQLAGEAQSDQLAGEAQSDQLAGEAQSDQLAGEEVALGPSRPAARTEAGATRC